MALILENIGKTYEHADHDTLHDVNLEIQRGEFVCIIGKSGCGKSTLLNLIAGLEKPSTGKILLDGREIDKPGRDRVVMFQDNALFPWLNTLENVCFGMELAGIPKAEREEKADYYLKMTQIYDYRNYPISQLSGGMRQRAALARAFTMDSDILLMDEPFSALDKLTSLTLRDELQHIWMKTHKTIIFITHNVEEAVLLADRIVVMSKKLGTVHSVVPVNIERPRKVTDQEVVAIRRKLLDFIRSPES